MIPVSAINVAQFQVATHPVNILRYRGNFRGTTAARWLQFFDSIVAPADGAVPVLTSPIPLNQTSPFYSNFEIGAMPFTIGCYCCVSTTESTKTLSTDTMDITCELDAPERQAGSTLVGDLTTPTTSLQVWTEATGAASRLSLDAVEVDGTNLANGVTQWIMLFATDQVNPGDFPVDGAIFPIQGGGGAGSVRTGNNKLVFGEYGREIISIDSVSSPTPLKKRYGCTVKISSTPLTFAGGNGSALIRAEYRTQP